MYHIIFGGFLVRDIMVGGGAVFLTEVDISGVRPVGELMTPRKSKILAKVKAEVSAIAQ